MRGTAPLSLAAAFVGAMAQGPDVALIRIPDVVYPPIAQSAMVRGDVHIRVEVRPDGSVAQATIVEPTARFGGLLAPAALEAQARVRVVAPFPICDHCGGGTVQIARQRTIKCLWLWRCGS